MPSAIARRLLFLVAIAWLGVQGVNGYGASAAAAITILESPVLRLEVSDAPYRSR